MTRQFFIFLVVSLIADPNFTQLIATIRDTFHQQLNEKEAEFIAQVISICFHHFIVLLTLQLLLQRQEKRDVDSDVLWNAAWLTKIRAFCQRSLSHSTLRNILSFWYHRQGMQQVFIHDQGETLSFCIATSLNSSTAIAELFTSLVFYIDSSFFVGGKAALSLIKPPYVESVSVSSGSCIGGLQLRINGRRLGQTANDLQAVMLGPHACTDILWVSNTEISCTTPAVDAKKLGLKHATGL